VILTRYEGHDRRTSYPVAVDDLVAAFSHVPVTSGFLPENCLFWGRENGQTRIAIYVPGRRWRMQVDSANRGEARTYHIPMPPLVFVGSGNAYQIYAVKRRPRDEHEQLYHAPCPNVHQYGGICWGNTPFPVCSSETIEATLTLFIEGSYFNGDLSRGKCCRYPNDVRQLWAELEGKNRFPLSELVSCRRVLRDLL